MPRILAIAGLLSLLTCLACSRPFPEDTSVFYLLSFFKTTEDARKYVFVSQSTYTGNLGGISGVDGICSTEKSTNFGSLAGTSYKALLDDGTNRVACTSNNCSGGNSEHTDWVLQASTDYYLSTGSLAFTTNANAIVDFGSGATLSQALDTDGAKKWWVGLDETWQVVQDCSNWGATAGFGNYGIGGATNSDAIGAGLTNEGCGNSNHLICVRQ